MLKVRGRAIFLPHFHTYDPSFTGANLSVPVGKQEVTTPLIIAPVHTVVVYAL